MINTDHTGKLKKSKILNVLMSHQLTGDAYVHSDCSVNNLYIINSGKFNSIIVFHDQKEFFHLR